MESSCLGGWMKVTWQGQWGAHDRHVNREEVLGGMSHTVTEP